MSQLFGDAHLQRAQELPHDSDRQKKGYRAFSIAVDTRESQGELRAVVETAVLKGCESRERWSPWFRGAGVKFPGRPHRLIGLPWLRFAGGHVGDCRLMQAICPSLISVPEPPILPAPPCTSTVSGHRLLPMGQLARKEVSGKIAESPPSSARQPRVTDRISREIGGASHAPAKLTASKGHVEDLCGRPSQSPAQTHLYRHGSQLAVRSPSIRKPNRPWEASLHHTWRQIPSTTVLRGSRRRVDWQPRNLNIILRAKTARMLMLPANRRIPHHRLAHGKQQEAFNRHRPVAAG